jgi:hypothetical protein
LLEKIEDDEELNKDYLIKIQMRKGKKRRRSNESRDQPNSKKDKKSVDAE